MTGQRPLSYELRRFAILVRTVQLEGGGVPEVARRAEVSVRVAKSRIGWLRARGEAVGPFPVGRPPRER